MIANYLDFSAIWHHKRWPILFRIALKPNRRV